MTDNFFVNPFAKAKDNEPKTPTYIKPDGTKVFEEKDAFGVRVIENTPNGAVMYRNYNKDGKLVLDYARKGNFEIGHCYDEYGNLYYKFDSVYDEHNVLAMKNEYEIKYYDNGKKKSELIKSFPGDIKTTINYDEEENFVEKIILRGSVKTWYDKNDEPIKREINRGSGGIITEDLKKK